MAIEREVKQTIVKDFAAHTGDSGSSAVQVALLTERIRLLTEHLQHHAKDMSSKRGLLSLIGQRKKHLLYLQRHNEAQYKDVIKRLGLKK